MHYGNYENRSTHELFHGCLTILVDTFAANDLTQRHPDHLQIEAARHIVHIPDIQFEFLFPRNGVAAVDLRPPGDAGTYRMTAGLFGRVPIQVAHKQRPRPNQAHVALDDVPQLGQFVQAGAPQKLAKGRQAIGIGQQGAGGIAGIGHRAEFDHGEGLATETGALLAEEDWSTEFDAHGNAQDADERHAQYQRRQSDE